MKEVIESIKRAWREIRSKRLKNKPPKHKHRTKLVRQSYMKGTNRYIDGKEIYKKMYRYDEVCQDCGETVFSGMPQEEIRY